MNQKKLKKVILENLDKLPLSYAELEVKSYEKSSVSNKITGSQKYNDKHYSIYKFYKPISRF